jgi:hypothetical protein
MLLSISGKPATVIRLEYALHLHLVRPDTAGKSCISSYFDSGYPAVGRVCHPLVHCTMQLLLSRLPVVQALGRGQR